MLILCTPKETTFIINFADTDYKRKDLFSSRAYKKGGGGVSRSVSAIYTLTIMLNYNSLTTVCLLYYI